MGRGYLLDSAHALVPKPGMHSGVQARCGVHHRVDCCSDGFRKLGGCAPHRKHIETALHADKQQSAHEGRHGLQKAWHGGRNAALAGVLSRGVRRGVRRGVVGDLVGDLGLVGVHSLIVIIASAFVAAVDGIKHARFDRVGGIHMGHDDATALGRSHQHQPGVDLRAEVVQAAQSNCTRHT